MENISAACRLLRDACNDYADAIDTCRTTLIAIGVGAGIVTAAGVLLSVFTFGGSDAAAAAGDAALAGETLAAVEAGSASAAAVAEAEAIVSGLAARLVVTTVVAGAGVAAATVPADAAPTTGLPPAGATP